MPYTSQISYKKPTSTLSDIIIQRQDTIHKQMYEMALAKYLAYYGYDRDDYRIVEIPASYFDSPSRVSLISKKFPFEKKTDTLAPFWGEYVFKGHMPEMKLDNDLTIESAELDYVDYVSGIATLHSRYTGRTFKVSLQDLPSDIRESDEMRAIENTFVYNVSK